MVWRATSIKILTTKVLPGYTVSLDSIKHGIESNYGKGISYHLNEFDQQTGNAHSCRDNIRKLCGMNTSGDKMPTLIVTKLQFFKLHYTNKHSI